MPVDRTVYRYRRFYAFEGKLGRVNRMPDVILSTVKVSKSFGGLKALSAVDIEVERGQIYGVIGPNGAGKTTLLNVISGLLSASEGSVFYKGEDITAVKPHDIVRKGLFRTFQTAQIFPRLTCIQNALLGSHHHFREGMFRVGFRPPFVRDREEGEARRRSVEALNMVGLADSADRWATDLTWSECQLLQVARALISEPEVILLDEPSAGMGPEESENMGTIIRQVRDRGITVVLITHDMKLVMGLADRITVLNFGEKLFEGSAEEVQKNPKVLEAYLGGEEEGS